MDSIIIELDRN